MGMVEQEEKISELKSGNCRLIVSTSVIEEGIDIPACDVIIIHINIYYV